MTAKTKAIGAEDSLTALCEVLALARRLALQTPSRENPTRSELLEALAAAQLSAMRLAAEGLASRRRPSRRG